MKDECGGAYDVVDGHDELVHVHDDGDGDDDVPPQEGAGRMQEFSQHNHRCMVVLRMGAW
jgi:hypothetical protein